MIISVDFDGTIVEHNYPEIGQERPFATDVLRRLAHHRHILVLWTVREGELLQQAIDWCEQRGVQFAAINGEWTGHFEQVGSDFDTTRKPDADVFIDDKAVGGLPSWPQIYEIIQHGASYRQILRQQWQDENDQADPEPPVPGWMFWKKKPTHK